MSSSSLHLVTSPWNLDPRVSYLNHGSFGACPRAVLEYQQSLRDRLEWQPLDFLNREHEHRLDDVRAELSTFIGVDPADLVFVPCATAGVNTVLRSLDFQTHDELLVTNYEYQACRNALDYVCERSGARIVVVRLPFPLATPNAIVEAIAAAMTIRTRLLLIDHVTSPTGLILPLPAILNLAAERGVEVLVDGAHAPGMIPLEIQSLNPAYYTGNCHKWLCAPKGAGFLYVQRKLQSRIRPLVISHGANSSRTDRSRFQLEFGWTGTHDPTPYLCVGEAIRYMGSLLPGGWREIMQKNHALALDARNILSLSLGIDPPSPPEMVGSMVALPLPDTYSATPHPPLFIDPLQDILRFKYQIEVPIIHWPPQKLVRISAQLYNRREEYETLADAIKQSVTTLQPSSESH